MLKLKSLINVFWVMTILFCCHSIDSSTAYAFNSPNGNENVIVDQCPREDSGQSSGDVSTISGDHVYPDHWTCPENLYIEYDTANSNETIDRNGIANLIVEGDDGPYYTWSVSGQGFWFDANYTIKTLTNNGLTATLYADDSACGAATIEVTGCSGGNPETGYVRCTAGTWEITESCDGRFQPPICSGWSCSSANIIKGKNLYIVGWNVCDQDLWPDCCSDPVITGCGHCPDGDAFMEYCEEYACSPCCDCDDICFSTFFQAYEWRCN